MDSAEAHDFYDLLEGFEERLQRRDERLVEELRAAVARSRGDRERLAESLERTEQDLGRVRAELDAVFRALPHVFFRLDRSGCILDCRASTAQDLAWSPEEMVGRRIDRHPERGVREVFRRGLNAVRHGTRMVRFEYPLGSEESRRWYEARMLPFGRDEILAVARNVTDQKTAESTIRHQAYHDALTGIPNRALFGDRLEQALSHARRHGEILAVVFLDLDHFKRINDTLGHAAGDRLLVEVASRLVARKRGEDTVARLGGDEFVLVITNLQRPEAIARVAEGIQGALEPTLRLDGHSLHVTASLGIALYPFDAEDSDTLLRNADIALYRAKERGRNTYEIYAPEMNARALDRLIFENNLRRAIETDELRVHYQPKMELTSGRVVGAEALVRWRRGSILLPAGDFIPIAEDTGLIGPIGEWVLEQTCQQSCRWRRSGHRQLRLAVNLSARQVRPGLPEKIRLLLERTGLGPEFLELELTESAILSQPRQGVGILRDLRDLGVEVAIDDFGTGHSSLAYLRDLPVRSLKIAREFVGDCARDPKHAAIVKAVIDLARGLGLRTVAEGVESEEQVDYLQRHGCDEIQGYFLSRPLTPGEFQRRYVVG